MVIDRRQAIIAQQKAAKAAALSLVNRMYALQILLGVDMNNARQAQLDIADDLKQAIQAGQDQIKEIEATITTLQAGTAAAEAAAMRAEIERDDAQRAAVNAQEAINQKSMGVYSKLAEAAAQAIGAAQQAWKAKMAAITARYAADGLQQTQAAATASTAAAATGNTNAVNATNTAALQAQQVDGTKTAPPK
jgi:hypothetical protein